MTKHDEIKTTQPTTTTVINCEHCGCDYDTNDYEHCPCRKECGSCNELKPADETFYKQRDGDRICASCVVWIYCSVEHPLHSKIEEHAQKLVAYAVSNGWKFSPLEFAKAAEAHFSM